jgi:hypothetical protein
MKAVHSFRLGFLMANQGELKFTLPKTDDLTAYNLVVSIADHFDVSDEISIKIAHGIRVSDTAYGKSNILPGEFKVHEISLNGTSAKTGQNVFFVFARYEIGKTDFHTSFRNDYASLTLGGDSNYWRQHPALAIEASALIARLTIPSTGPVGTEDTEIFRQLIIGQDATHRRMLSELNQQLTDLAARRSELEQEAAAAEQARRAAHDAAQRHLEMQQEELDRQSHMAERRKIGKGIIDQYTQGARVPGQLEARSYGMLIFFVALGGGIIAALLAYQSLRALEMDMTAVDQMDQLIKRGFISSGESETPPSDQDAVARILSGFPVLTWFLAAKVLLTGLVAVGAFTYAAAWLRRYYDDALSHARKTQQLAADVSRASWVIEAIHEVFQQEGEKALPAVWVEAVTRNLFASDGDTAKLDDGSLALKALMGLSANVSVGPDGLKADLNKRGLKEIGKAGD